MEQKNSIRTYVFSKNKIQITFTFVLNILSSMLMVYAGYSLSYYLMVIQPAVIK